MMHLKFKTSRKWFVKVTLLVTLLWLCFFQILPDFKCPLLTSNESVNRLSRSTINSLVDHQSLLKNNPPEAKPLGNEKIHSIMWYTKPDWISTVKFNDFFQKCEYGNCRMINDTMSLENKSAVIFTLTGNIGRTPPVALHERPRDQVWVFFYLESTLNLWRRLGMVSDAWRSSMNWSMTYRLDSDILVPYGTLATKEQQPVRDYQTIYRRKSKFAAWFVSNCNDDSDRAKYVRDLRKYGIPVDIYGKCGEMGVQSRYFLKNALNNDYKFYFAFENSLCKDYITEKFFANFDLDVVLVVRGGANYRQLLPKDTFIDTSDFSSPQAMANYLAKVNSSENLYSYYLRTKHKYYYTDTIGQQSTCKLCEMLNHRENYANIYENLNEHLYQREYSCQNCRSTTPPYLMIVVICVIFLLTYICLMLVLPVLPRASLFTSLCL